MGTYNIIIDSALDVEELSAVLNTHDDTGDLDPDKFVRMAAVCAALAYCNAKVSDKDRGDYKKTDFQEQCKRIDDSVSEFFEGESYKIARTAIDLFIASVSSSLIMALADQSHTPIFSEIKEDLSLKFMVTDGKNENDDSNGVSDLI